VVLERPQLVAVAIIADRRGVLVGRRLDGQPPWTFIGGKVEPDESPAAAAVREVEEETGLRVQAGAEVGRRIHPRTRRLMIYLACRTIGNVEPCASAESGLTEVRWLSLGEVDELMPGIYPPVRAVLDRLSVQ
jgi:8-oxo-dGTP diphosphatase